VELIKQRKRQGFDLLYRQYGHIVFGMSMKMVKDRIIAEDLLQETIIKAWRNIHQFSAQKASFSTWLLNIARYTIIDYLRSKQHKQRQKNQSLDNSEYQEGAAVSHPNADIVGLKNNIARMEPKYREILDLIYFKGYTQDETAQLLGIPLGTVKTRTRFALDQLRKVLSK
jgi:RNA polymerase sigma-70 factor (ECF subfamily)